MIGTITTRYMNGSIDHGGGCDVAPEAAAIRASKLLRGGQCIEFAPDTGRPRYYLDGAEIECPWRDEEIARLSSLWHSRGSWISVRLGDPVTGKVAVTIDGVTKSYHPEDLSAGASHADPAVAATWREIERRALLLLAL